MPAQWSASKCVISTASMALDDVPRALLRICADSSPRPLGVAAVDNEMLLIPGLGKTEHAPSPTFNTRIYMLWSSPRPFLSGPVHLVFITDTKEATAWRLGMWF